MSYHGSVTCSWCTHRGHNKGGCEKRKTWIKENPDSYDAQLEAARKSKVQNRKCSYCKEPQHTRRTCPVLKTDKITLKERLTNSRADIGKILIERGIGVGSLVCLQEGYWDDQKVCGLIEGVLWSETDRVSMVKLSVKTVAGKTTGYREINIERLDNKAYNSLMVLSPITPELVEAALPIRWKNGNDYKEEDYLPKGQPRPWCFQTNESR